MAQNKERNYIVYVEGELSYDALDYCTIEGPNEVATSYAKDYDLSPDCVLVVC